MIIIITIVRIWTRAVWIKVADKSGWELTENKSAVAARVCFICLTARWRTWQRGEWRRWKVKRCTRQLSFYRTAVLSGRVRGGRRKRGCASHRLALSTCLSIFPTADFCQWPETTAGTVFCPHNCRTNSEAAAGRRTTSLRVSDSPQQSAFVDGRRVNHLLGDSGH